MEKWVRVEDVIVDTAVEAVVDTKEIVVEDVKMVEMDTVEVRRGSRLESSSSLPLQRESSRSNNGLSREDIRLWGRRLRKHAPSSVRHRSHQIQFPETSHGRGVGCPPDPSPVTINGAIHGVSRGHKASTSK
ncbi:hypothetical protein Bca52824_086773 [Brassica carinata]|uniref:Uncharacterized protein n=1 Tax=Brassica carinata TaxID=52824 RepID=A0A8X7P9M5_BRACI|nr:hypothetical protein Bca52824_086773 [Brassica carinata]